MNIYGNFEAKIISQYTMTFDVLGIKNDGFLGFSFFFVTL